MVSHQTSAGDDAGAEALRVVIVDDHELFRTGLRDLLGEHGLDVVGEAASGEEALELIPALAPDVVMMDLGLPGISGVEATRRLGEVAPQVRVLVLSISADEDDVTGAIAAGACGYLLKDASIGDVVAGVRAAAVGASSLSPQVAAKLVDVIRAEERERQASDESTSADLSPREIQVLRLVAQGKENLEIARELFISPQTVKNHVSNILVKLGVDNRIQAAVHAVRAKLL
jgi:DNA-binding NarL/FixJ family response regulator